MSLVIDAWGLAALAAVPAIVAVHLFRRRFRPRAVTALFLYPVRADPPAAGRRRHRLVRTASLVAELAAALAATWWLCDPHASGRDDARHLVVVLDARARLQAIDGDGASCADRLKRALGERIAALSRDDRVTLIASGAEPRLLCGPAARAAQARAALATWTPEEPWHPLASALALARQVGGPGAELVCASDRIPDEAEPDVGVIAAGIAAPTSGLAEARWIADAAGQRVVARVLAQGARCTRDIALRDAGGVVLARKTLALEPGEAQLVRFAPPAGLKPGDALGVTLVGDDAYPLDDAATVLAPTPRPVRVRVAPAEGKPAWREATLRALAAVPEAIVDGDDAIAAPHLQIGPDAVEPSAGRWSLRLAVGEGEPALGPFLARAGHPLLAEVDCTGVIWRGARPDAGDGEALLVAGDAVLLEEVRSGRDRAYTLWCDLAKSSLARHPAWPALIANLVSTRRRALPGVEQPDLVVGESLRATLPPGHASATLIAPDGVRTRLAADGEGALALDATLKPGVYRLALNAEAAAPAIDGWQAFVVQPLDPRLADLAGAQTTTRPATGAARARVARSRGPLAHLLPIACIAVLAVAAWRAFAREDRTA